MRSAFEKCASTYEIKIFQCWNVYISQYFSASKCHDYRMTTEVLLLDAEILFPRVWIYFAFI